MERFIDANDMRALFLELEFGHVLCQNSALLK